jgi:hypothetical protein
MKIRGLNTSVIKRAVDNIPANDEESLKKSIHTDSKPASWFYIHFLPFCPHYLGSSCYTLSCILHVTVILLINISSNK